MAKIVRIEPWGADDVTGWLPIEQIKNEYRQRWMGCLIIVKK